jgi:hypothetical protein
MDINLWPIYDVPKEITDNYKPRMKKSAFVEKYPFSRLEVGQCFIVKASETTKTNMQTLINYRNKKDKTKSFRCSYDTLHNTDDIVVWREV